MKNQAIDVRQHFLYDYSVMGSNSLAVFPGSFDPLTNGHMDIIQRSLNVFDNLIVAVLVNAQKQTLFTIDERTELIKAELKSFGPRVEVQTFSGLLVEFMRRVNARAIVRGLRAVSDYEFELQMALMNRHLDKDVETVFLTTTEAHSYISSSLVKQVAVLGGNVRTLVPNGIAEALKKKLAASK